MAEYIIQSETLTSIADAIREKTGLSNSMSPASFADAIGLIEVGGSPSASVIAKDVNFIDYDGSLLYSYTVAEAQALTELPPLPSHDGLICQGWNYALATIKEYNRGVTVGAMYITDDGKTRIYIHLEEGRTAPLLGCCPNGTVIVDWGDGSATETLTGTSTSTVKWTNNHQYASAGDYVITLTVDGTMGFYGSSSTSAHSGILRFSSSANMKNRLYQNAVTKIEIGNGVTSIGSYAFQYCYSLTSISISNSVTSIGTYAFQYCYSITGVLIPDSVTSIGSYAFMNCYSLTRVLISNSVTSIGASTFQNCYSLTSIVIPDSVTSIASSSVFMSCYSLTRVLIPDSVTSIGASAFQNCAGVVCYDFLQHTAVPSLYHQNVFTAISADCEIRVPAALVDEWKAATNWSTYAAQIVGV